MFILKFSLYDFKVSVYCYLSYDVAICQKMTSYHMNLATTSNNILAHTCNIIDNDHVNNMFSY